MRRQSPELCPFLCCPLLDRRQRAALISIQAPKVAFILTSSCIRGVRKEFCLLHTFTSSLYSSDIGKKWHLLKQRTLTMVTSVYSIATSYG